MDENTSGQTTDEVPKHEGVQRLESEIQKEISKLKFYLEQTDELIESNNYEEMSIVEQRTTKINEKLSELISRMQELKIELDVSSRSVRQWRKEVKLSYAPLVEEKGKITKALQEEQEKIRHEEEQRVHDTEWRQQQQEEIRARQEEREERLRQDKLEQERQIWQERLHAEIKATKKKLELETKAKSTQAKLSKLKISPFNGTPTDWIRFDNMFTTQEHNKPISDEEKFGYLLEMSTQR